jgi:hypothetical protein
MVLYDTSCCGGRNARNGIGTEREAVMNYWFACVVEIIDETEVVAR